MTKIVTRFAPSPTGYIHIGNSRIALINWLFARKHGGEFILRVDDTDLERCRQEYKDALVQDLKWLGLNWDQQFNQRSRLNIYEQAKARLISSSRLYPCFETPEELEIKRKLQLSRGLPPIYDRAALKLSQKQIDSNIANGLRPHYRFKIEDGDIRWQDMVKGDIHFKGKHLADPIIVRADGSMTYMLCSTIDDIDYGVNNVIRGEDHISNTAIQIQMFESLGAEAPNFGHLSLVKAQDDKISKRTGGYAINSLRSDAGLEPMAINSFFSLIGTSKNMHAASSMEQLIDEFDICDFSKSPTTYMPEELNLLNHKLLINQSYNDIAPRLTELGLQQIDEKFWLAVRPNLKILAELKDWWEICHNFANTVSQMPKFNDEEISYLRQAAELLPDAIDDNSWQEWTTKLKAATGRKGKALFMPLRLALSGASSGPELKNLLPLLERAEIVARLQVSS